MITFIGCDEQTTWSIRDGIISQIKAGLNSFQQLKGRVNCLDLRWNRRALINEIYVLPMEITFMDIGGHIFVLDEFIEHINSHIRIHTCEFIY